VAELSEDLIVAFAEGVRVGEEKRAAHGAQQGEYIPGGGGAEAAALYTCFKEGEDGDDQRVEAMLEDVGCSEALPERARAERPAFGIGAQEDEDGESEEKERPIAGPVLARQAGDKGQQAGGENDESGPVVDQARSLASLALPPV
jgi:hypothetical protein